MKLTNHAVSRAKDRMSWSEETLDRIAVKAFNLGKKHADFSGKMRRYLDKLYLSYGKANNMRIYGENLFIFSDDTLITIYQIPKEFRKYL